MDKQLLIFLIGAALSVAILAFTIVAALEAGGEEYARKFTKTSSATLDEMFVFMPSTWILNFKVASMMAGFAVGGFLGMSLPLSQRMLPILFLGLPAFMLPDMLIARSYKKRITLFHEQLIDGLQVLSNGLKAGLSLPGALQLMADESSDPLSGEFRIVVQEVNLGSALERALDNLTKRIKIDDLRLFVASVNTVYTMGTGLVEVCDRAVEVIRERFRIQRRIETLTAEGRMQAAMLCSAPFALMFVLYFVDPKLVNSLFNTFAGMIILVVICVLDTIGFFVIRKITDIRV